MAVMSSLDFWWPLLVAVALFAAICGGFRMRMMLLTAGLAIVITDAIVVRTLKDFVGRPRPHEMVEGVRTLDLAAATPRFLALARPLKEEYSGARIRPPRGKSFPSAHAANNFAVATVCAVFFRRWGWLLFLPQFLSLASRLSRLALALDVLSGLLGLGIGLPGCRRRPWQWWGGQARDCTPRTQVSYCVTAPRTPFLWRVVTMALGFCVVDGTGAIRGLLLSLSQRLAPLLTVRRTALLTEVPRLWEVHDW